MPDKHIFYFHSDHLGSSSYITTVNGQISQHVEYIAFGEVLFEEHASSFKTPYLYNGKELDREIRSIRENKKGQLKKLSKRI